MWGLRGDGWIFQLIGLLLLLLLFVVVIVVAVVIVVVVVVGVNISMEGSKLLKLKATDNSILGLILFYYFCKLSTMCCR